MNIGIVIWSLFETRGGLERAGCDLATAMLERGHQVSIFYKKPAGTAAVPLYPVPVGATLAGLSLNGGTLCLDTARAVIVSQNIDILVAMFSWESLLWFPALLVHTGIRLVISEHTQPERIDGKWNSYERRCCLFTADAIHVLTESVVERYPEALRNRLTVIGNPVRLSCPALPATEQRRRRAILGVGRFDETVKQFSLLIRAFHLLQADFPDWNLEICGDGEAFAAYASLIAELGLGSRVSFPGMIEDIAAKYSTADIFCIPSRVEGFPMALAEACFFGLPCVGFAACPGTNELIAHGATGLLAGEMTPQCLAESLAVLMRDEGLRRRMGEQGRLAIARYDAGTVYDQWERLLHAALRRGSEPRIQELLNDADPASPEIAAAQELIRRKHPFDRSAYLKLHTEAKAKGKTSPFTDREVARFIKRHKRFGFPGYRTPLTMLRHFLRRYLPS